MKHNVKNLEGLRIVADRFLRTIIEKPNKNTATVIGLSGDLGSGKTAFTKCVASILDIAEVVTSPTFILEKIYSIPLQSIVGGRFTKLIHIDAYRLHSPDEMRALGWGAIIEDEHNLVLLEWPEQVEGALPKDMITIYFSHDGEGLRQIKSETI